MENKNYFEQEQEKERVNAAEQTEAAAAVQEADADNDYVIKFKKPYNFEGEIFNEIDLSGLEDMSARDMIQAQRIMEKSGSINVLPEMSLEYACIFASRATGYPVEFFQGLPSKEAIKLKNKVTNFFYGAE